MLAGALALIEACGVCVVPAHHVLPGGRCSCGQSDCESPGKHPIGKEWTARASADPDHVHALWARDPYANVGIATGATSGIIVIDVDGAEGEATIAALEAQQREALPPTVTVLTSRGRHLYFASDGSPPIPNRAGKRGRGLGDGVDVRGEGGFVIAPPSVHASGFVYCFAPGLGFADVPMARLPAWIVARVIDPPRTAAVEPPARSYTGTRVDKWAAAALDREIANVRGAAKGSRNDTLNRASFNVGLIAAGGALDGSEAKRALRAAAIDAGLTEFEAVKTITSAFAAAAKAEVRRGPERDLPRSAVGPAPHTNGVKAGTVGPAQGDEPPGPSEPTVEPAPSKLQPRHNTAKLFEPLPDQRWAVPGLQLGPGRPTLIAGYGASAKTISVQSLALALAAGRPIWEHYESSPMSVLHIDYEQTLFATAKRYQRLAVGHGINLRDLGDRLHYVEMPRCYLDDKGVEDEYIRACDGFDLIIIDALRGASPRTDENDSSFRSSVDVLTYVSQRTGASIVVLHHASKPKKESSGDVRTIARGSSAIFDASGCVFNFVQKQGDKDNARLVQQVKTPAEAEGQAIKPFELVVEDVCTEDGNPTGGVRVVWREPVVVDEAAKAAEEFEKHAALIMRAVRRVPEGQSANAIVARCGVHRNRALDVLRALADEGRLESIPGRTPRSKLYRVRTGEDT
jgi:hypothetical protein